MSDRECGTCWWFTRTCNMGEGFCDEKEDLVFEDDAPCDSYKRCMKQIGGDE